MFSLFQKPVNLVSCSISIARIVLCIVRLPKKDLFNMSSLVSEYKELLWSKKIKLGILEVSHIFSTKKKRDYFLSFALHSKINI